MNKCLLTPDTEPLTVQVRILSKSSLVTQIVSLGLFPGVWVRAYLWKQRVFRELGWSLPLPGGSPCLKVSLSSPTINTSSGKREPRKPCQFQGLPKFFSGLFSELMSLPGG